MYLQITTRCNMMCEHCCYSCSPSSGKHMSLKVVDKAMDYVEDYCGMLTIGGGEPTIHPNFWAIMEKAIVAVDSAESLFIITNGKKTCDALKLARMIHEGSFYGQLSQDPFHDPIDPRVVKAFGANIRNVYRNGLEGITNIGRAKRNQIGAWSERCVCADLLVDPNGTLFACGCKKERFGTIFDPRIPEEYWDRDSKCTVETRKEAA